MSLLPIGGYLYALLAYVYVAFNVSSSHYLHRSTSNRQENALLCLHVCCWVRVYNTVLQSPMEKPGHKTPLRLACQRVMEVGH